MRGGTNEDKGRTGGQEEKGINKEKERSGRTGGTNEDKGRTERGMREKGKKRGKGEEPMRKREE